ncbi:hypothetical protein [Azospirillum thermophilum]|uniref:Uncharacterized protein n=1 Tax=Azospirillum thermophilum TaxID=2202148 RepID=A0A2S2CSM3_9PROT|nr:hypothetical protein [Azospirillum thermophilum]AWK87380.1 hypothetical protein DEW08_15165 [Azospirillum thermophilum]
MTDQVVGGADYLIGTDEHADLAGGWGNSPFTVFPALVLLLIMPLAILFHPTWIVLPAVLGAFTMLGIIVKLTRG